MDTEEYSRPKSGMAPSEISCSAGRISIPAEPDGGTFTLSARRKIYKEPGSSPGEKQFLLYNYKEQDHEKYLGKDF